MLASLLIVGRVMAQLHQELEGDAETAMGEREQLGETISGALDTLQAFRG
jgi:hypothetical protein